MAAKALDRGKYANPAMPSYARFLHLYFLRDWRKHFHDLHKAITYVCRYGK